MNSDSSPGGEAKGGDASDQPIPGMCYGPKLCGYLARSYQVHDAPKNADSIAYFILSKAFQSNTGLMC